MCTAGQQNFLPLPESHSRGGEGREIIREEKCTAMLGSLSLLRTIYSIDVYHEDGFTRIKQNTRLSNAFGVVP